MVAVIKGAEVSDSALEVMQSYYDQLSCLETKIPFSQAKIYFKWLDAFEALSSLCLAQAQDCVL